MLLDIIVEGERKIKRVKWIKQQKGDNRKGGGDT